MLNFDERNLKFNKKQTSVLRLEIDLIKPFSNRILISSWKSSNSGFKSDAKIK